ncbi:cyclic pyranopterin monophosphate synthase accessory protein [Kordiimonas sediminis]|uniref:Cyclic pyranopterin monophosphate synthase n=1 Tax=Kordiimonas sediminis TaxID=1735581 RepID=A0A919AVM7_9PROT|nr:cyclic pyranopterin monophosphate synthase MoaC [Kordiimonas sediminis]GHF28431.1 cyclic pyranopterin monophosphate synthase accessory protein [Kordiimonas sediminis]
MTRLSHLDQKGQAHMVDVGEKDITSRQAVAESTIEMKSETLDLILSNALPKGDVIATARIAGIMAAKKTSDLIPMCHPLPITSAKVKIEKTSDTSLRVEATVKVTGKTGVEMEALTAATVAALTLYDMAKSADKDMIITSTRLLFKSGGKSGTYTANSP